MNEGWNIGGLGSPKPLFDLDDKPLRPNGMRFSHATHNSDGELCEVWKKDWIVLGAWIIYEEHDEGCECSYCKDHTNKKWGIWLPKCRCRNAWRVLWWRKGNKWPYQYHYLRITLPSFMRWKCRRCRKGIT